jgi:hypothetical protein
MKSVTYPRHIENSREIVSVSTVTFGSKNEPTPICAHASRMDRPTDKSLGPTPTAGAIQ